MHKEVSKYRVERLADLPFYTEGPGLDSAGNIYYTTLSGKSIYKIDRKGIISEWAKSACPNGQYIMPDDEHLICDSVLRSVRRYDAGGNFIKNEVEGFCAGEAIYSPNDLVVDNMENIYFTDSIRRKGKVFFVGKDGEQKLVATELDYPNGLVLSAGMDYLFVAESYKNRIIRIDLRKDIMDKNRVIDFAALPRHFSGSDDDNLPDGIAIDQKDNLWVAHYGMQSVHKISADGALLNSFDTGMRLTSNLIFGSENTIIITGGFNEPGPGAVNKMTLD